MIRSTTWRRVATTVVAAASALAIAVPTAGAAPSGPIQFEGAAEALALELNLTAPGALLGPLGVTDGRLIQQVSTTLSELSSVGTATASSALLDGLLDQRISSSDGAKTHREALIAQQDVAGILSVGAGTMEYTADAAEHLSRSFSELANLSIGLAPLFQDSSPVPAEVRGVLQDAVDTATGTVNELVGELNGVLDQVEDAVGETLPDVAPDALPEVPDITSVNLLDVRKMWSESTVTTEADYVLSTARSGIVEASILGGLIKVPTFQYETLARTNGEPGGAFADGKVTTIAVQVADESIVAVEGSTLRVGDVTLNVTDTALLGEVTDLLTQILNAVGLSVSQGELDTFAAEDGSRAEASTSAFALSVHPLNAAGSAANGLFGLDLDLLPTRTVAAASNPVEPAPAPPAPQPAVAAPQPPVNLPRTGGGAVPVVIGVLAMAGALGLRRGLTG